MNRKAKGARQERRTIRWLEAQGYACTRAAASLGAWDVIAVGPERVLLVQVKSNNSPRKDELARLAAFRCPPNCTKLIFRWKDRAKVPEITSVTAARSPCPLILTSHEM